MRRLVVVLGALALISFACGGESVHADVSLDRDPASVEAGRQVFLDVCAECHGDNLEGATNDDDIEGPELTAEGLGHPDSDFVDFVTNGKGDDMPAQEGELSSEEILSVIDYVRSVQKDNLPEE